MGFWLSQIRLLVNTPAYFLGVEGISVVDLTKDTEKDVAIEWISED